MIKDFRHKGLEAFFRTGSKKGIQGKHRQKLGFILDHLDSAGLVTDMSFPGSGFHSLKGDYEGYYTVTVSGNWRVIFQFEDGYATHVDYVDYH